MRNTYSQNGEDTILWRLFEQQPTGIFVDIGSHDGKVLSNTLSFEEAGWKGICAEAHPVHAKACITNRPNSIVVNAAISYEDRESVTFYATDMGHLSTLDKGMESYFRMAYKKHFKGFHSITVPMRTVNTLLQTAGYSSVDFISIDVEGSELDVMRGFYVSIYHPRVILTEAMLVDSEKKMMEYMKVRGYTFARKTGNNLFFCRDTADVAILGAK